MEGKQTLERTDFFFQQIKDHYGYDFSGYSRNSFLRRLSRFKGLYQIDSLEELLRQLLADESFFEKFLQEITVNITEMFRDPLFFKCLREKVVPQLKTYPHIRVWGAGCATGEEAYSLNILLHEENLGNKTRIYATDINQRVVEQAAEGIYNINDMSKYTGNYQLAGGMYAFSNYYHAKYQRAILEEYLKKNIVFSIHNLAADKSFNEFNLIVCRNVLIYFDKDLQNKVIKLFIDSLKMFGYLALGSKESLLLSKYQHYFEVVDGKQKIFRKIKE